MTNIILTALSLLSTTSAVCLGGYNVRVWIVGNVVFVITATEIRAINIDTCSFHCLDLDGLIAAGEVIDFETFVSILNSTNTNVVNATVNATLETVYPWQVAAEDMDITWDGTRFVQV